MRKWLFVSILCASLPLLGANYKAKDYSSLIEKMPDIDSGLLETHFKLYKGYVDQVNFLNQMLGHGLSKANGGQSFMYQCMKRRYGWEYDGMVLHELYFDNLGGDGKLSQKSDLFKKIVLQYGSLGAWRSDFEQNCFIRGIGWVILYWNPKTGELRNAWVEEHDTGELVDSIPLLVIDLWEHAYLCQFGLDRKKYVQTVMKYINWDVVNSRLK